MISVLTFGAGLIILFLLKKFFAKIPGAIILSLIGI